MKLSVLLMVIGFLQVSASGLSQMNKVNLDLENVPFEEFVAAIEQQTDYRFVYLNETIQDKFITAMGKTTQVSELMAKSLADAGLNYEITRNNLVIITPVEAANRMQPRTITGKITDENGEPVPGANILIKGTTTGTISNLDGEYQLQTTGPEDVLVFSFVGLETQEVATAGKTTIDITLKAAAYAVDEVVVTALGIKRDEKSLGYAIQKIDGDELAENRESNFTNMLSGKVAGMDVRSSGGVGGSTRIILRGESSLNLNANQPLFVVDGVPISNSTDYSAGTSADYGNAASELNPADIESVNVLKGPAASALYGSRGANGVVVITTKSGRETKGLGVSVTTGYTIETPLRLPKLQNEFGTGWNGMYEPNSFAYNAIYPNGINEVCDESWGPRLDGTLRNQFDSPTTNGFRGADVHIPNRGDIIPTPWVAHPDNMKDYFSPGHTRFLNFEVTGSNDKINFRSAFTNMDQKGFIPNNDLQRNTIAINSSYSPNEKFTASVVANYIRTTSDNRPNQGYGGHTPMYFMVWLPRNINIHSLKDYWQPGLEGVQQFNNLYAWHNNPYFYQNENTNGQIKDRIIGNLSLNYQFTDRFSVSAKTVADVSNDFRPMKVAFSTQGQPYGSYSEHNIQTEEMNFDFLAKYDFRNESKFGAILSAGANRMEAKYRSIWVRAPQLQLPEIYNFGNTAAPIVTNKYLSHKRINSIYALAQFDYDGKFFVDLTARNDWSSTLPPDNNSYLYPSVAVSTLLHEALKLPGVINFAKLRFSWAQVGNDTGPYNLLNTLSYSSTAWDNQYGLNEPGSLKNPEFKPELITTYEVGANVQLLASRLGFDVTYYDIKSENQILNIPITSTSGYTSRVINAGEINNRGVEIMVNAVPIKLANGFEWSITLNFSKNYSEVVELAEGIDSYVQNAEGEDATLEARVGERMGAIYGPAFERVPDGPLAGQPLVKANGRPVVTTEPVYLGNANPDWMGGISNRFSYKGLYLSGLLDIRQGGVFISRFWNKGMGSGILYETGIERAMRPVGEESITPEGLPVFYYHAGAVDNGDGTYSPNQTKSDASEGIYGVIARDYYKRWSDHISEAQLMDASYVKLKELSIGYTIPQKLLGNLPIRNIQVSITGRNLWLWTDNMHFDPEVAMLNHGGGLVPGFENMALPSMRSWSFNLKFNL